MARREPNWGAFEGNLASTLRRLRDREFLIIQAERDPRRYVQFVVSGDVLDAEAPSSEVVADAVESVLRAHGWSAPTAHQPNWTSPLRLPASIDASDELAARCIAALRDAYGIESHDDLNYRAWRDPAGTVGGDPGDPALELPLDLAWG